MPTKKLLMAFFLLTIFACQPQKPEKMTLTLHIEGANPETEYKIFASGSAQDEATETFKLAEGQTEYTVDISIDGPKMIPVYGDFYKVIYAEPGKELTLKATKGDDDQFTYSYDGAGSAYMNVMDQMTALDSDFAKKHEDLEYRQFSLEWEDYNKQVNQIYVDKEALIANAEGVSSDFKLIMDADLFAGKTSAMSMYGNYFNYYQKEEGAEDFVVPGTDDKYKKAFEFDKIALVSSNFSGLVNGYVTSEGVKALGDMGDTPWYSLPENWKKMYEWVKEDESVPVAFKEHMLSSYVSGLTMSLGIDGAWDIKEDFVESYPNASSVESINASYAKWEPLKKGKVAPDFEYESLEGEMVSLSSLKGNVVYVDVWATWCGPCIAEFPSYKILKERLKDAKDVKWVYVSVDEADDKEKWEKFIAKNELSGIQLFSGSGWETKITELYQIQGIPRYILVDKEGNIHSSNAPRPSSGDLIYNEIQKLRGVSLDKALSMK